MSLTFQYGPSGGAIQLATRAGQGQRQQQAFADDMQFQGLVNQMQAHQDQKDANSIGNAISLRGQDIGQSEAQAHLSAQLAQNQSERDIQNQRVRAEIQNNQGRLGIEQQNADTMSQYRAGQNQLGNDRLDLKTQEYGDKQDAIGQLPAEAQPVVAATGRMPVAPHAGTDPVQQYRLLAEELRKTQADVDKSSYDRMDPTKIMAQESTLQPGVISGREDRFNAGQQRVQLLSQAMKKLEDSGALTPGNKPAINAGTIKQLTQQRAEVPENQQSAPDSQPRIVATATNPKTGEKVGYDANTGQWVPIQ